MSENRRIRVFVSSTFRDMVEERDELMTHAWPELRRLCRERQVELVEVDLRWGIAEEQTTRKETLKLCLDEIKACRPFFIALLGERYGWTPGPDAFTADLEEEQPWLRELKGKSVTELEILHGVLNNPEMAGRSFFYFRDPSYALARGKDFLSEDAAAVAKQAALKDRIRRTCAEKQIPLRENSPNPHTLATLVLDDLTAAIKKRFPIEEIPDPLAKEARDHEAFAETRRRTYIGRPEYFARLDSHAAAAGGPLVLLGESGSGKSALLANWIEHWRAEQPRDFIFQHYIGGTPDSADHYRLMARLIAEIKRWSEDPDEVPHSHDDLKRDFGVWLAKARARAEHLSARAIVVLDALNQVEDQDHARMLGWLPDYPLSGALRLMVSTLPGEALDAVNKRGWETLTVSPLTTDEQLGMIERYLARFGKKLDASRLERIASVPAAANPLFLKTLLDELRVTGTYEGLDFRLDAYLAAPDIPSLLRQVLDRWQRDYERDRPGLVGETLGLIWAARRGLTEPELLALLRPPDLPQLPAATWSPLRAALDENLIDRGGILNFAHDFLRSAVDAVFISDQDRSAELRLQLADHFEHQAASARSCDELPWLLWRTASRDRLRACLTDMDRFLEIQKRDRDELLGYWVWLKEDQTMAVAYISSFEPWAKAHGGDTEIIGFAANELAYFVAFTASLYSTAEPLMQRSLELAEHLFGKEHPEIATRLTNLAILFQETNRASEAEPLMRRALAIDTRNFGRESAKRAQDLNILGRLLHLTNRIEEAESVFREALDIGTQVLGEYHATVALYLNNLAMLLKDAGSIDEAEQLMRRALSISERTYPPQHPSIGLALNNLASVLQARGAFVLMPRGTIFHHRLT